MIEVLLSEGIRRTAVKLPPELREKTSQAISKVVAAFGDPTNIAALAFASSPRDPMKFVFTCSGAWFLSMMELH